MLYLALTRPALTWGVPFEALALNVMVTFAAGLELSAPTIWRSPVLFWAAAIPIHIGLRRLTSWDYHWFRTVRLWALTRVHRERQAGKPADPAGALGPRGGEQWLSAPRPCSATESRSRITSPTMSC